MRPLHAGSTSTNVDSKRAKMMATIDVINSGTDTRGYIDGVAFQSHFGCDSVSDWSADGLRAVRRRWDVHLRDARAADATAGGAQPLDIDERRGPLELRPDLALHILP